MFRFNANISYSGVLHAVTQDVSVSNPCVIYSMSIYLPGQDSHSFPPPLSLSFLLFRVFSRRTKRSSSTTPFWLFYPRRLSCQLLTLNWRAISRLFDGWWPRRLASRLLPSCLSKNATVILLHLSVFISLKYTLGWAAGNRHALSFQGLVKGLEAQMQRKYESIHLSVPFCLFLILVLS